MTAHPSAVTDALVVGGGPAGAAAAIRLAEAGRRVLIIDRGVGDKACGDLLSPRAVRACESLGIRALDEQLTHCHRVDHVKVSAAGRSTSTSWPSHHSFPDHGFVIPRRDFDQLLLDRAVGAGATLLADHDAVGPIVERGFVRGARTVAPDGSAFEVRGDFTIVADGANSRFGRELGTFRQPSWPHGAAHRAVYRSALHDAREIELVLDLRDRAGTPITGYGWMFPRGDGTVNVGVIIMSTSPSFQVVRPARLLERFVDAHRERWHLDGDPVEAPAGGRIPLGTSVGPVAGPTYVLVGDAAGAANPMSGAGIEYAIETGIAAGDVVDEAFHEGSAATLQHYPKILDDRYGSYYKVGRLTSRMFGQPAIARQAAKMAARSHTAADVFVRMAANEMRHGHVGIPETVYRLGRALNAISPDA